MKILCSICLLMIFFLVIHNDYAQGLDFESIGIKETEVYPPLKSKVVAPSPGKPARSAKESTPASITPSDDAGLNFSWLRETSVYAHSSGTAKVPAVKVKSSPSVAMSSGGKGGFGFDWLRETMVYSGS